MAKRVSKTKNSPKAYRRTVLTLTLASIGLVVALTLAVYSLNHRIDRYQKLSGSPNPACLGLAKASTYYPKYKFGNVSANAQLDPGVNMEASFNCLIDKVTKADTIQGKPIGAYQMGAYAIYFKDSASAKDYAGKKINPLRYWGYDPGGQSGVTQNGWFVFIVGDGHNYPQLFDAYTVKENVLVRISLPCDNTGKDAGEAYSTCGTQGQSSLVDFAYRAKSDHF